MVLIVSDWDETISAKDTLSLIAPAPDKLPSGATTFEQLSHAYFNDLERHNTAWKPAQDLSSQLQYLACLDEVELQSQKRIEDSKLFTYLDDATLENRARSEVPFRKGWNDVARWIKDSPQAHLLVISVGWSAQFIGTALSSDAGGRCLPERICANEVEFDAQGRGTGKLTKSRHCSTIEGRSGIRVAQDKSRELSRLLQEEEYQREKIVVYCGDSNTDLLAFLEADIGLIFGEASSLLKTLARIGHQDWVVSPEQWFAGGAPTGKRGAHEPSHVLVHVQDWVSALPVLQRLYDM